MILFVFGVMILDFELYCDGGNGVQSVLMVWFEWIVLLSIWVDDVISIFVLIKEIIFLGNNFQILVEIFGKFLSICVFIE